VAGCSVRELMLAASRSDDALSPLVAVSIVEQACRGAHAAHELTDPSGKPLGLVHRDITPHNLMIAPSGDVKLLLRPHDLIDDNSIHTQDSGHSS